MNTNFNLGEYAKSAKSAKFVAIGINSTVVYEDIAQFLPTGLEPQFTDEGKRIIYSEVDELNQTEVVIWVEVSTQRFGLKVVSPLSPNGSEIALTRADIVPPIIISMTGLYSNKAQLIDKHTASAYGHINSKNVYSPDVPVIGTSGDNANDVSLNGFDFVLLFLLKGKGKGKPPAEKVIKPLKVKLYMMAEVYDELMNDEKYKGRITEYVKVKRETDSEDN